MQATKVEGSRNEHKIFLYTLSTCGWCKKTKELLKERGVTYEYIDVDNLKAEERKIAIEDLKSRNATLGFPVIIIDNSKIISGFKEDQIKEALGL